MSFSDTELLSRPNSPEEIEAALLTVHKYVTEEDEREEVIAMLGLA